MEDTFYIKIKNNTCTGMSVMPGDHIVVSGNCHEFSHYFSSPLRIRLRRNAQNKKENYYLQLGSAYNYDMYYEEKEDYVGWRLAIKNSSVKSIRRKKVKDEIEENTINLTIVGDSTIV